MRLFVACLSLRESESPGVHSCRYLPLPPLLSACRIQVTEKLSPDVMSQLLQVSMKSIEQTQIGLV